MSQQTDVGQVMARRTIGYGLERTVERAIVEDARTKLGVRSIKLALRQNSGWPDRIWLLDRGRTWWTEFKAPGAEPVRDGLQMERLKQLTALGHDVAWYNDYDVAWAALKERVG